MSERQWKIFDVMKRLGSGLLTTAQAAQVLGLSTRQVRRIRRFVEEEGKQGVMHGNAGRAPVNRASTTTRALVMRLFRTKYAGFNDQHFTEKLVEVEGIAISRASVQRVLRAGGLAATRTRRERKHRRRRDRKAQAGLMMLWDGSIHDWLEGRGPKLCLMGAIDDATGELLPGAHFVEQECAAGYLRVLLEIAKDKGLPCSGYMDQHSSLRRNDPHWTLEEELRGEQDPTQVGRALKALEVEVIFALSPQAKGRVERLWGTLQDRLVSELRLAKARTREQAQAVLERFRHDFNGRFTVEAKDVTPAWRTVRKTLELDRVCSFHYAATVLNDNTVRLSGQVFDIPPGPGGRSYARAAAEVRQLLDGTWRIYVDNQLVATAPTSELGDLRAKKQRKRPAASRAFRKAVNNMSPSLP